ncbi:YehS family protein [Desulfogranum mediterraneum]|uniref:DUF1456 family protein n=1 Tax=Desulfogranum mediterraneum TaxID=160661 RepID=UPI00040B5DC7|nr:DUF1456 family protein [Desulfogranum mediterraneum]
MTNNDVLRRIRYIFDFSDAKVVALLQLADQEVSREEVRCWLQREEDPDYLNCSDRRLAGFLNGLIIDRRGRRQGEQPKAEKRLTNNLIFKKLKIALDLQAEEVLAIMDLADLAISKHELSAFFRRPDHKHYRLCKDQILRNFLHGLQLKYRPNTSK